MKNETIKGFIYAIICMLDLLAVTFIILKLTKSIDWNWLIVLSPFWGQHVIAYMIPLVLWIAERLVDKNER